MSQHTLLYRRVENLTSVYISSARTEHSYVKYTYDNDSSYIAAVVNVFLQGLCAHYLVSVVIVCLSDLNNSLSQKKRGTEGQHC